MLLTRTCTWGFIMHLQRKRGGGGTDTQRWGLNEKATLLTTEQQRPKPDRSSWKHGTWSGHWQFCFGGFQPHLGNICWDLLQWCCHPTWWAAVRPSQPLSLSDVTDHHPRLRLMLAMFCLLSSCKHATSREPQKSHKAGAEMGVNLHLSWHLMWFWYLSLL